MQIIAEETKKAQAGQCTCLGISGFYDVVKEFKKNKQTATVELVSWRGEGTQAHVYVKVHSGRCTIIVDPWANGLGHSGVFDDVGGRCAGKSYPFPGMLSASVIYRTDIRNGIPAPDLTANTNTHHNERYIGLLSDIKNSLTKKETTIELAKKIKTAKFGTQEYQILEFLATKPTKSYIQVKSRKLFNFIFCWWISYLKGKANSKSSIVSLFFKIFNFDIAKLKSIIQVSF